MIDSHAARSEPTASEERLASLASWAQAQLAGNILPYWERHGRDATGEGFLGEIREDNTPVPATDRSIVMVSRHLWTYAAAARFLSDSSRLALADDAYRYLVDRFRDREHGGFYWTVKRDGTPAIVKKQIYGQAFAIYALAEYSRVPSLGASVRAEARSFALAAFDLLESHARERRFGGYLEALAVDWKPTADRSLSPVDIDCDKSMNTNLHVLEALTNLYRAVPSREIREAIVSLLEVHARRIVRNDGHLGLYFRSDWSRMDKKVSYGHDIEAAWLMEEAIEVLETIEVSAADQGTEAAGPVSPAERDVFSAARSAVDALAKSALEEGVDAVVGCLEEEAESSAPGASRNRHRIWWCQAEAMVGFLAAWQRSHGARFLDAAIRVRDYVDRVIVDQVHGEWHWGADGSDRPILTQSKGGNWKAGYHDGRACMEIIRRAVSMNSQPRRHGGIDFGIQP